MTIQYIVRGDMDARGMHLRQGDWRRLVVAKEDVQLNLARVDHLDSSGLGAILFLYKRVTASRRKFEIINAHGQPLEFLTKFDASALLAANQEPATRRASRFARVAQRSVAVFRKVDQTA